MRPLKTQYYTRIDSESSARAIVPLIMELVRPKSVIDVGCGTGVWLSVFKEHGVADIWGVDGEHITEEMLQISGKRFTPVNLELPFSMNRMFDLVVSLEVAEHLSSRSARTFVDTLTGLGPVVLFSAAVPHQGYAAPDFHVNEQWPEYWANLFYDKGYVGIDCIRSKVWYSEDVQWWYAQNVIVFAAQDHMQDWPSLKEEFGSSNTPPLSIVHPRLYLKLVAQVESPDFRLIQRVSDMVPRRIKKILRAAVVRVCGRALEGRAEHAQQRTRHK
jgi:SAM-dependent methyltransferase